tara:strand:- start:1823 stop:2296 length:474 start_codon:yes stop_codon:yes gene_type:complete
MNKSERNRLAQIVANMKYDFDSIAVVIDKADDILSAFPCIKDDVDAFHVVIAERNLTKVIQSSLCQLHAEPHERGGAISNAFIGERDSLLSRIADDYFCDIEQDQLFALEDVVGAAGKSEILQEIEGIIFSIKWRECVLTYIDEGSDDYLFFTGAKS